MCSYMRCSLGPTPFRCFFPGITASVLIRAFGVPCPAGNPLTPEDRTMVVGQDPGLPARVLEVLGQAGNLPHLTLRVRGFTHADPQARRSEVFRSDAQRGVPQPASIPGGCRWRRRAGRGHPGLRREAEFPEDAL